MKKLLLLLLFSGSLDGFSQAIRTLEYPPKVVDGRVDKIVKPDTLRAICLVTLFPNGIAHARMGFVVIEQGKRPVYLDCRKRALKIPQVGWGYELIDPNYKR